MPVQRIERGDLWKSRVKVLSLRLRDRFRVVVHRRRRHKQQMHFVGDGYFSSTVNRWLRRFHDFRRDSLPSSSAFYCKEVSKDLNAEEESTIVRMLRAVAVPVLGNVCHVFMKGLNRVEVYGLEKLYAVLLHRPKEKPLVTVSNHVSSVDDPFVIAALLPPSILLDSHNLRWTLCASDRCFTNPVFSAFFRSVKVLPVARGDGIYQKGMDMAIAKLNRGGWVHIFPEGSRSRDGGKTMGSSKRGVGRLILDTDNIPMVVPFVHTGMQEIMPVGANIPRIGKTVTVLIGDPIHFDDWLDLEEAQHIPRGELYSAIASRIGHRLHELKIQVDRLALEQAMQSQYHPVRSTEEMVGILQQVDWESFGMDLLDTKDDSSLRQESEILPRLGITCSREPTSSSIGQETHIQPRRSSIHRQEPGPTDWFVKEGIVSRVRGFRDPTDLMGFAARGLFMNLKSKGFSLSYHDVDVGPLKAWKQFSEANVFRQCSYC